MNINLFPTSQHKHPTLAKNQVGGKTPDLDISHIAHNNNNKR